MFVRPVNFVDYFEILDIKTEFSANLFLYDVDKDNDIELLIGNWDSGDLQDCGEADVENRKGELNIIKYGILWKNIVVTGIVSCISAGYITKNINADILVFCSNCLCYFYTIINAQCSDNDKECCQLKLTHEQTIAPNAKNIVIKDIDNDGTNEVIVGFTDRIIRLYKWVASDLLNSGYLMEMIRWDLCSQIGGLTIHCSPKHGTQILASLTGGSYAVLFWKSVKENDEEKKIPYIDYKPMINEYKDNLNADIRSEIIGNIRRCNLHSTEMSGHCEGTDTSNETGQPPYFAVCTIDGQVMLLDDNEKIWQVHLGRGELFGLSKVDITNNDAEEVVVCSWEGVTYIINHHKEIARFYPKHQCQAFLSGTFSVAPGVKQPVMIYSTFENSLMIYYNLNLDRIPARSLLQDLSVSLKSKFKDLGIDTANNSKMQRVICDALYKWPMTNRTEDTSDFYDNDSDTIKSPLFKVRPNRSEAF